MQTGHNGSDRDPEHIGRLLVRKPLHIDQQHRLAVLQSVGVEDQRAGEQRIVNADEFGLVAIVYRVNFGGRRDIELAGTGAQGIEATLAPLAQQLGGQLAQVYEIERLHADGEQILAPLRLSEQESSDLLAFIKTLSDPHAKAWKARPMSRCLDAKP